MGSESIKICVITTFSITLRAFLVEQLVYLSQNGFDVTVVCGYDPIFKQDCPPELRYVPIHMTRRIEWWFTLTGWWKLFWLFKREKFKMIQYSTPKAALISSLAGFIAGIPIRLYCQWGIYYVGVNGLTKKVFKLIEKFTCFCSTDIAPDSQGNLEFAISEGLYPCKKGSVVYNGSANGVNLNKFDIAKKNIWRNDLRAELKLNEGNFVYGGIVAIEAQAIGVPVITTDIPGPQDAIINGETGMLIPAGDQESLMAAMYKLKNDQDLLKSMGDKGILFVRENFEQGTFWKKVLKHRMSLLTRVAK